MWICLDRLFLKSYDIHRKGWKGRVKVKKYGVLTALLLLILAVFAMPVSADEVDEEIQSQTEVEMPTLNDSEQVIFDFTIYGTYDYAQTQKAFQKLNTMRSNAGVGTVVLDPTLTEAAMQRAAEIAVYYDKDNGCRPDGSSWESAFTGKYEKYAEGYYGCTRARGYSTAEDLMSALQGQSNPIWNNSEFRSVGIGCYYQEDGTKYWIIYFSSVVLDQSSTPTKAKTVNDIPISVDVENINGFHFMGYNAELGYAPVYQGCTEKSRMYISLLDSETILYLSGGYELRSTDTSLASTSGLSIKGVYPGIVEVHIVFGNYYFSINYKVLNKPTISGWLNDNGKPVVSCSNDGFAQLYYKKGNGSWVQTSVSSGTYVHTDAVEGAAYTYVMGYYDYYNNWKEASSRVTIQTAGFGAPEIKATNVASTGKVKLSWNAIDGAVKYKVYRATSQNGTYKLQNTVTGTSMINKSAVAGKTYYYYVVAVDKNGKTSAASNIVKRVCDCARPEIKLTNDAATGKVKISWSKVEGAVEYKVYRSTSKNGTYTVMNTVTGTSLINKSGKAGKLYYYKVKAIANKEAANSAFSEIKSRTCDIARPTVKITLNGSGKPKLTWSKVDGAVKYKVYRSTSKNGEYSLMSTVSGTSYVNKNAKVSKTYYYKVVAVANKSAANSAYSGVVFANCTSVDIGDSKIVKNILKELNAERKAEGLDILKWYTQGELAARIRASEIRESFTKDRPDGSDPETLWKAYGIDDDCLARNADSAAEFVSKLMASKSTSSICMGDYSYAVGARDGKYWVVMFK